MLAATRRFDGIDGSALGHSFPIALNASADMRMSPMKSAITGSIRTTKSAVTSDRYLAIA